MIDLSEKSREEVIREKKEAELRLAKRKEGDWKRRMDKERKCMIGGTFLKYFKDSLLFEPDEWDRIVQEVIMLRSIPILVSTSWSVCFVLRDVRLFYM